MKINLLFLLILISCSQLGTTAKPKEGKTIYSYSDVSGSFKYLRESRTINKKLVTRSQILLPAGDKVVEKSITVSQVGTIKDGKSRALTIRPLASEFSVWLEGKKYSSKMQLNPATKSMRVTMDSPEAQWRGKKEIPFPKGKYFCFFSQIPDCLYHNQILTKAFSSKKQIFDFYIVWDSYPYMQEQYSNVGNSLFSHATIKYDGEPKKRIRYTIETGGQVLLFIFTKNLELASYSWISQGVNLVLPGEEVKSVEE